MSSQNLFIQDVNGKLWTASEWDNTVAPNGIALKVGDGYSVMSITNAGQRKIHDALKYEAPDMPIYKDKSQAVLDFDGIGNTELMAGLYGTDTQYAVGTCMAYTFPNGEKGYLPSAGELNVVINELDYAEELLSLCGGGSLLAGSYVTSTRGVNFASGQVSFWFWIKSNGWTNWAGIDGNFHIRPFSRFQNKLIVPWDEGEGNIYATYYSEQNGNINLSSDINDGIDREQTINVSTTKGNNPKSVDVTVRQIGLREVFTASDGDLLLADGGTLNVLK